MARALTAEGDVAYSTSGRGRRVALFSRLLDGPQSVRGRPVVITLTLDQIVRALNAYASPSTYNEPADYRYLRQREVADALAVEAAKVPTYGLTNGMKPALEIAIALLEEAKP